MKVTANKNGRVYACSITKLGRKYGLELPNEMIKSAYRNGIITGIKGFDINNNRMRDNVESTTPIAYDYVSAEKWIKDMVAMKKGNPTHDPYAEDKDKLLQKVSNEVQQIKEHRAEGVSQWYAWKKDVERRLSYLENRIRMIGSGHFSSMLPPVRVDDPFISELAKKPIQIKPIEWIREGSTKDKKFSFGIFTFRVKIRPTGAFFTVDPIGAEIFSNEQECDEYIQEFYEEIVNKIITESTNQ